jgi:hypothetical protein
VHCCDSHRPVCADKEAGFSVDTRLLRPKGMNGLKILISTSLLVQTSLPTTHQLSCRLQVLAQLGRAHTTHPQSRPTLSTAGTLQGVPPSCCGRRAAVWSGLVRTDHQGLEKRLDAQAACEPGGGGCGGVPVHHLRLHTHRTSPAQALLTTSFETC